MLLVSVFSFIWHEENVSCTEYKFLIFIKNT